MGADSAPERSQQSSFNKIPKEHSEAIWVRSAIPDPGGIEETGFPFCSETVSIWVWVRLADTESHSFQIGEL